MSTSARESRIIRKNILMFTPLLDVLLLSVLVTPLIGLIGRRVKHEKLVVAAYVTLVLAVSLIMIPMFYQEILWRDGRVMINFSPEETFMEVNRLSVFMTIILFTIGITSSIFSVRESRGVGFTGYYMIFLSMIVAMVGVIFSGSLFTLFIFWEVMCFCSYTLVAFRKERW